MKLHALLLWTLFSFQATAAQNTAETLINAVKDGDLPAVKSSLRAKVSANSRDSSGRSALSWAILKNRPTIVEALLKGGADANLQRQGETAPLMLAAHSSGDPSILEMLSDNGAEVNMRTKSGWTPLLWAITAHNEENAKILIGRGANIKIVDPVDGLSALGLAKKHRLKSLVTLLEAGEAGIVTRTARTAATHTEGAASPLPNKATLANEVPQTGPSSITDNRPTDETTNERIAQITTLPAGGTDVSVQNSKGSTLLIRAASEGRNEEVQLLLGKSATVQDRDDDGWSALMHAAYQGHLGIVRALLDRGADVNAKTKTNSTPLIAASSQGHTEVVELLLSHKAYPNAKDASGKGAIDYASEKGYVTVVGALKKYDAVTP